MSDSNIFILVKHSKEFNFSARICDTKFFIRQNCHIYKISQIQVAIERLLKIVNL